MSTKDAIPTTVDLRKYIDTRFYGARPHIRGRRVLVSMISANAESNNLSIPELAHEFSLSQEEILAALLYYREHKELVDQQDMEEQTLFDETYRLRGKNEGVE